VNASERYPGTFKSWQKMRARCNNPNQHGYARYGGRGITCCERWAVFDNFLADMGERPEGRELDRINNDGNYEAENCRWATRRQQTLNTSKNRRITYQGESLTLAEWARKRGLSVNTLASRLRAGWSVAAAITQPVDQDMARRSQDALDARWHKPRLLA
jgi:hypothetical protein